jgi:hypothetical protein
LINLNSKDVQKSIALELDELGITKEEEIMRNIQLAQISFE